MVYKSPRELNLGDNLEVSYVGGTKKYFEITGLDNIYYQDSHSALAAAGTESYAEISNLDPPEGQIYIIDGIEVDGNVAVYLKQPAATNRLGTNKSPEGGMLYQITSGFGGPRPVNIAVTKDYAPNVQLVNNTDVSITATLYWTGVRFSVRPIGKPSVYTPIKIGGISE